MFQKGTGERFKYKQEVLKTYPDATCKKRIGLYAVLVGDKRFSEAFSTAENAWANAWAIIKDREKTFKREFKFRIFEKSTKRMRYFKSFWDLLHSQQSRPDLDLFFIVGPGEYPHQWQQYVGLSDKNKTEIYEGDIMQCTDSAGKKIIFVCEYGIARRYLMSGLEVDIPSFYFLKQDGHKSFPIVKNCFNKHDLDIIEVIGNVDENPELLKKLK